MRHGLLSKVGSKKKGNNTIVGSKHVNLVGSNRVLEVWRNLDFILPTCELTGKERV